MSRRGMIYTSFAIISAGLLLIITAMPVSSGLDLGTGEATRIGEASFFLESVMEDMERALKIATRRAMSGSVNYVVETGEDLEKPEENVTSALVNGTISGFQLNSTEEATLDSWTKKVSEIASRSGYSLSVELRGASFNSSRFTIKSSFSVFARLKDPSTLASFNETGNATARVSVSGLEDTMLLLRSKGRYLSSIERCSFDDPAEVIGTGHYGSSGAVHGRAVVNPPDASSVENRSEKVLAVDDVDSYSEPEVEEFAGVVSAQPNSSAGYSNKYVFDLSGRSKIQKVEDNMSLILEEDRVWRSGFRRMFLEGCYLEDPRGPGFLERLDNELVSADGGIATLIDVSRLPSELRKQESAVGYVYFNGTGYGSTVKIEGVTGEYSWFRLDEYHVDLWGLEELFY